MPRLKLQTAGRPELSGIDGRSVQLARQPLALLVYLMLEGPSGRFERGPLMRLFWRIPNDNALSTLLGKLRRAVGEEVLPAATKGQPVVIHRELVVCDVVQFEESLLADDLARAESLAPDDFLGDWAIGDYPGFARWAAAMQSRFGERHRECLANLATEAARNGDGDRCVRYWGQYAGTDFGSAVVVGRAMREIHGQGATDLALDLGERYRAFTNLGAGVTYDPSIGELIDRLKNEADRSATPVVSDAASEERVTAPTDEGALRNALAEAVEIGIERATVRAEATDRRTGWWRIGVALLVGGLVVSLGTWWIKGIPAFGPLGSGFDPDTTVYVVFPFQYADGVSDNGEVEEVEDAVRRWRGVALEDPLSLGDRLRKENGVIDQALAASIAAQRGAGRFIRGAVTSVNDSVRIFAGLYDATRDGALLYSATIRRPGDSVAVSRAFTQLVDALLLRRAPSELEDSVSSRSLPARQAYAQGLRHFDDWLLSAADSSFSLALHHDPTFAEAHLRSALVRAWDGQPSGAWVVAASNAFRLRQTLSAYDRQVSEAMMYQAQDQRDDACTTWSNLAETYSVPFLAWYGTGHCLALDSAVYEDARSPSGYFFRSSYHRGLLAFVEAFLRRPALIAAFRRQEDDTLRKVFTSAGFDVRRGFRGDTPFSSYPGWVGDSLTYYPKRQGSDLYWATTVPGHRRAVEWIRRQLQRIAEAAVATNAADADGLELLAIALAVQGNPSSLDTLRRARDVASDHANLRLASTELWMSLVFSVAGQRSLFDRVIELSDSLLLAEVPGATDDPLGMAGVAALRGRVSMCLAFLSAPGVSELEDVPVVLRPHALSLQLLAAFGAPADTLKSLSEWVERAIEHRMPAAERRMAVQRWLGRPAALVYPATDGLDVRRYVGNGDRLVDRLAMGLRRADSMTYGLGDFADWRAADDFPGGTSVDRIFTESRFLEQHAGPEVAAAWLDPVLATLPHTPLRYLTQPVRATMLVRVIALKARLAHETGSGAEARRWAVVALRLWEDADEMIRRDLEPLRELAEGPDPL